MSSYKIPGSAFYYPESLVGQQVVLFLELDAKELAGKDLGRSYAEAIYKGFQRDAVYEVIADNEGVPAVQGVRSDFRQLTIKNLDTGEVTSKVGAHRFVVPGCEDLCKGPEVPAPREPDYDYPVF